MLITSRTILAANYAYHAHDGQSTRSGMPYITHPFAVAENMTSESDTVLALLHDILEDCNISIDEVVESVKLSEKEKNVLDILTHKDNMSYEEYIYDVSKSAQATRIKIADLRHNMDLLRLMDIANNDIVRTQKYMRALKILVNNSTCKGED